MGALIESFDEKLDLVLENIKDINSTLDEHSAILDDHSRKFDRIDIRLETIEAKLDQKADTSDFQKLEKRVTHLETKTA